MLVDKTEKCIQQLHEIFSSGDFDNHLTLAIFWIAPMSDLNSTNFAISKVITDLIIILINVSYISYLIIVLYFKRRTHTYNKIKSPVINYVT